METNNTTPRFTINKFKEEIKELAKLQHEEKLFFKHPDKHKDFVREHFDLFNKSNSSIEYCLSHLYWLSSESQSRCESRRGKLASMYNQYYALKHWKKLDMDNDMSLAENYLYPEEIYRSKVWREESILKACTEKKYNDPDYDGQRKDLYQRYKNREMDTKAYCDELDKLPKTTYVDHVRKSLLKHIDKEE